jgi:hypothetical protein
MDDPRVLWNGTGEEFWAAIDRYIRREELESDWNLLNEVLEIAQMYLALKE